MGTIWSSFPEYINPVAAQRGGFGNRRDAVGFLNGDYVGVVAELCVGFGLDVHSGAGGNIV